MLWRHFNEFSNIKTHFPYLAKLLSVVYTLFYRFPFLNFMSGCHYEVLSL